MKGKEEYNRKLQDELLEGKVIEGLGEAGPQLLLQSYIYISILLEPSAQERIYQVKTDDFKRTICKFIAKIIISYYIFNINLVFLALILHL